MDSNEFEDNEFEAIFGNEHGEPSEGGGAADDDGEQDLNIEYGVEDGAEDGIDDGIGDNTDEEVKCREWTKMVQLVTD